MIGTTASRCCASASNRAPRPTAGELRCGSRSSTVTLARCRESEFDPDRLVEGPRIEKAAETDEDYRDPESFADWYRVPVIAGRLAARWRGDRIICEAEMNGPTAASLSAKTRAAAEEDTSHRRAEQRPH